MTCTEFLDRYSEYDDSLVPPGEADRFRAHMAACDGCQRYDRVLRKGRMLARQLPGVEPSDDFVPRLRVRLGHECPGSERWLEGPARAASGLAAMTVLLTVTVTFGLLGRTPDLGRSAGPEPRLSSRVVPQLPAVGSDPAREWAFQRVDRQVQSSYSPLITGPPAYRGAWRHSEASVPTYRTLD